MKKGSILKKLQVYWLDSESMDLFLHDADFCHETVTVLMWFEIGAPVKGADIHPHTCTVF